MATKYLCNLVLIPLLWLSLLLGMGATPSGAVQAPPPQVLIVDSYHQGDRWSDDELAGITSGLQKGYPDLVPCIERLDSKRRPGPDNLRLVSRLLTEKYWGRHLDLVMALDNSALGLVLERRSQLFPGVPVVFAGVNGFTPAMLDGQSGITGVKENEEIAGTLDLILAVRPQTRRVLAVCDHSVSGQAMHQNLDDLPASLKDRLPVTLPPTSPSPSWSSNSRA
jgi:hypothetical protein